MTAAGGYIHPAPSTHLLARGLAGRAEPRGVSLEESYELCRQLQAAHGRTYYLATRLLPRSRRKHVYALYAFARYADDLVDHLGLDWSAQRRRTAFELWSASVLHRLGIADAGGMPVDADGLVASDHPVLVAACHTISQLEISHEDVRAFLRSMAMDLAVTRYATYADLCTYMHGSAAVIGTMMLPVLGADRVRARQPAMDLGMAFQLTNFLRDVAEDWDRGRIYLPVEDLERFGVSEADFEARRVGPAFRRMLAFEVARTRALYRRAESGWALLPRASRTCIRVAHRLYSGILDALERADYQVFDVRAAVPHRRKAAVVLHELVLRSRPASPWWALPGADGGSVRT